MSTRVGIKVVPGRRAGDDAQGGCLTSMPLHKQGLDEEGLM